MHGIATSDLVLYASTYEMKPIYCSLREGGDIQSSESEAESVWSDGTTTYIIKSRTLIKRLKYGSTCRKSPPGMNQDNELHSDVVDI